MFLSSILHRFVRYGMGTNHDNAFYKRCMTTKEGKKIHPDMGHCSRALDPLDDAPLSVAILFGIPSTFHWFSQSVGSMV